MLQLYWYPQTRSSRVVWMLEECGLEFEKILVNIRDEKAVEEQSFQLASPMGKVPAIKDGDALVADSAAICLYLADRYASGKLAPTIEDPKRGEFLYWMFFSPGVIEPCMAEAFGTAQPNPKAHGWGDFSRMVATLEARLEDREWVTDSFSAADVMIGSTCNFMRMFGIGPDSKLINAYVDRCLARDAYKRALTADAEAAAAL